MKINRRFFLISSISLALNSYSTFSQPLHKNRFSKKEYMNKILKYLKYNKKFKNNQSEKLFIEKNLININGWIFTKKEVLDL